MTTTKSDVALVETKDISPTAKVLFSSIAKWLSGDGLDDLQLEGTDSQINAIKEAMEASRGFQEELLKTDSSLKSVTKSLQTKIKAAKAFEKELGVPWLF